MKCKRFSALLVVGFVTSCVAQQSPQLPPAISSTVVVVGSPNAVTLGESSRSVVVMDMQEHPRAFQTIEDRLRTDSSTYIEQRGAGGAQADISMRGTSFEQTLVLINGLRINDAQTAHHNLDLPVPMDAMSSIEVLHGSGSTLYGSDAMGGVVDFTTAAPETTALRLRTAVGSFGENDQAFTGSITGKKWSELASGERNFSTGFIPDRDYRNENGSSETRWKTPSGESDILLAGSDRAFGADQFYGNYNSWERTKGWLASIQQGLGEKTDAAFGYRRHSDNFILLRDDPAFYANQNIDQNWQGALRRSERLGAKSSIFYGLEGDGDSIQSNNLGRHARNWGAGYLDADMQWRIVSLTAGLRQEIISGGYHVTSPALAGSYWLGSSVKARASLGYGFRLPTYTDLYYSDPSTIGNPNLKPESGWNYEAGADWFVGSTSYLSFTGFYSRQHDTIDYVRPNANSPWQASNLTNLRYAGVEGAWTWQPVRGEQLKLAWTFLSGAQQALHGLQSEYVFNYPVNNAVFEWIVEPVRGYMLHNRLGITQRYQAEAYPVWNAAIVRERGHIHPYLQMSNLSNTGYQEIIGVPMPGRSFTGGVDVLLGKSAR
jgi:iron complex outermembrane receptor protein